MATTAALVAAREFASNPTLDAAVDLALSTGASLHGSSYYVVVVAIGASATDATAYATALGLQLSATSDAYVGAVTPTALSVALTPEREDGGDFDSLATPAVVAVKDDAVVAFAHTTRAALGRAVRASFQAYLTSVEERVTEGEDPTLAAFVSPTDYGRDVSTFLTNPIEETLDLDPNFTLITGTQAVAEAVSRRLVTPRGALAYDPDFGTDLRDWLEQDVEESGTAFAIASAIESECLKDERVSSAEAEATYDSEARRFDTRVAIELVSGQVFRLTLSIDAVTASVLKVTT
jgi:hypothetical protein